MQFKQKLAYMALGGVLVFMGQLLPHLIGGTATAQKSKEPVEFDTIRVQRLEIVDEKGKPYAFLEVEEVEKQNTFSMNVFNHSGELVYQLGTLPDGKGMLQLSRGSRRLLATSDSIIVSKDNQGYAGMTGGSVFVGREQLEKPLASMYSDARGGGIRIWDKEGTANLGMGARDEGGYMLVFNKNGSPVVDISGVPGIALSDDNGTPRLAMFKTEIGASLVVLGNDKKNRVVMTVDDFGNGVVVTWDKHGYRIK